MDNTGEDYDSIDWDQLFGNDMSSLSQEPVQPELAEPVSSTKDVSSSFYGSIDSSLPDYSYTYDSSLPEIDWNAAMENNDTSALLSNPALPYAESFPTTSPQMDPFSYGNNINYTFQPSPLVQDVNNHQMGRLEDSTLQNYPGFDDQRDFPTYAETSFPDRANSALQLVNGSQPNRQGFLPPTTMTQSQYSLLPQAANHMPADLIPFSQDQGSFGTREQHYSSPWQHNPLFDSGINFQSGLYLPTMPTLIQQSLLQPQPTSFQATTDLLGQNYETLAFKPSQTDPEAFDVLTGTQPESGEHRVHHDQAMSLDQDKQALTNTISAAHRGKRKGSGRSPTIPGYSILSLAKPANQKRKRSRFSDEGRQKVAKIRATGACMLCKYLKISVSFERRC